VGACEGANCNADTDSEVGETGKCVMPFVGEQTIPCLGTEKERDGDDVKVKDAVYPERASGLSSLPRTIFSFFNIDLQRNINTAHRSTDWGEKEQFGGP
jgi:hypothetical protein